MLGLGNPRYERLIHWRLVFQNSPSLETRLNPTIRYRICLLPMLSNIFLAVSPCSLVYLSGCWPAHHPARSMFSISVVDPMLLRLHFLSVVDLLIVALHAWNRVPR